MANPAKDLLYTGITYLTVSQNTRKCVNNVQKKRLSENKQMSVG